MVIAETERLILRHFSHADASALYKVFGDAEVMRYGPGVQTAAWIRDYWLPLCFEAYRQKPGLGRLAMVLKAGGEVIGYCGLIRFPDLAGQPEIEIGYRLARSHWGQGYATEAAWAVRDHAFDVLGLPRLIALVDPANTASIRVAEKIGMSYEKDVLLEGYDHPDHVYVITCFDG